jgi:hypothetical protein
MTVDLIPQPAKHFQRRQQNLKFLKAVVVSCTLPPISALPCLHRLHLPAHVSGRLKALSTLNRRHSGTDPIKKAPEIERIPPTLQPLLTAKAKTLPPSLS